MAGELKLNNVSVATESGGVVSLSAANTLAFPAGHVIQVVQDSWQGKTSSLSNPSVWTATGLEKDIQISSGNYVLVECVLAVEVITSGTNGLVALASGANNTTVDNSDFIIDPWMIQGLAINDNVITAGQYLHTTPQSSVPQRYKVFVKPEAGYAVQYGAQTGAGYFYNTLTLYEIQA
tara:strand:+ start:2345 stop:2878 length:534 start_codon:yes stop_codon:yes gene_type:complete